MIEPTHSRLRVAAAPFPECSSTRTFHIVIVGEDAVMELLHRIQTPLCNMKAKLIRCTSGNGLGSVLERSLLRICDDEVHLFALLSDGQIRRRESAGEIQSNMHVERQDDVKAEPAESQSRP